MTAHKDRAIERGKNKPPINYTCGSCRKVHTYDPKNSYICPDSEDYKTNEEKK